MRAAVGPGAMGISSTTRQRRTRDSLVTRTLWSAALRIALVSLLGGAVSYTVNRSLIEETVRKQLVTSTQQKLQRESIEFAEIKHLQKSFLDDFNAAYAEAASRRKLASDFGLIFHRHADGSYTQKPGIFEGEALPDGRRYASMSATYSPDVPLDDDVKARFALSFQLSHKYGSTLRGRVFNFYGVVPEKGFPIYQASDIAKVFTYSGPDALKLETYEFYSRGFAQRAASAIYTRMYWDASNNAWMTTIATPDVADASGRHKIMACVDVLLDELMQRTAAPLIPGSRTTILEADAQGTLIFDALHSETIKSSEGQASITSLNLQDDREVLSTAQALAPGDVRLIDTPAEIVAVGRIPETPWALAVRYPRELMRPSTLLNLGIVIALGLATLLVEIFIVRAALLKQVAAPLDRLIAAIRAFGPAGRPLDQASLPIAATDEIGEVAREFAAMAARIREAQDALEDKVHERTTALESANEHLHELGEHNSRALEEERKRVARELHDELGQQLAALRMEVSVMRARAAQPLSAEARQLDVLRVRVDHLVMTVRQLVSQLRPPALDAGLGPALAWLGEEYTRNNAVPCHVSIDPQVKDLPAETATMVFRIAQESLNNARRHSNATEVTLSLGFDEDGWCLTVRDNGQGFDTSLSRPGYGLLGMEERARLLRATLTVSSAPGQGSTVSLRSPGGPGAPDSVERP